MKPMTPADLLTSPRQEFPLPQPPPTAYCIVAETSCYGDGALTDSRKRLSADHRLLPSLSAATLQEAQARAPPLLLPPRRPLISPPLPPRRPLLLGRRRRSSIHLLPFRPLPLAPPPPLPRPIHGPHRVVSAFRLGPARCHSNPSCFSPSPSSPPPRRSLGLEQYVELVIFFLSSRKGLGIVGLGGFMGVRRRSWGSKVAMGVGSGKAWQWTTGARGRR
ncbi:hypothetical protein E2562_025532 [Oryza meyeriana var. granulata]|uniref:Uncharacterized protein n=1 Tax=Oryza meyeriana var. granulata TaxID=110450 RepID=A0A6G1FC75_9ORYZ|nr:hypothetical protein E2562_025532 [Oryza meyeriana var. granulata]KAF0934452.1 hypothetical protein E2562_025532 [Oryza meyeriana var. granulata]KAF0934453.1 hypothetical protein E2562_025532 [Oryza meyeriana var. granulata]